MVEHALTRGFWSQVATGAWAKAAAAAAEAHPLAASTGHMGMTAMPTAESALIAAFRGDDAADTLLDAVAEIRRAHPVGITDGLVADLSHWAAAVRTSAQPAVALHHFEQMTGPSLRRMATLDLFDVAARGDRPDILRAWLADVEAFAVGTGAQRLPRSWSTARLCWPTERTPSGTSALPWQRTFVLAHTGPGQDGAGVR